VSDIPHELAFGDLYLSPLLPVFSVALLATWITVLLLNKLRLSRYIMLPSLTFLTLMAFYMLLLDAFWLTI
tara:strand:+ start:321608 stop:321820 length:213 start_codon:yes stop_codon:yes gene_type:complete